MGSYQKHEKMVDELYENLENDFSEKYKWIKEIEYLDTDAKGRKIVGEMDLCGVHDREDLLVYLEVKSSFKQIGKGRKQIKRAKDFWKEKYDIDVYGRLVLPDYSLETVEKDVDRIYQSVLD